jgi:UPF0716 protein FxsA
MSLVKWTLIGLLLLPVAELLALLIAAALMGWPLAIGLFIATSVIGVMLLRRCGRGDLDRLRAAIARDGIGAIRVDSPGAASLLGGILLVFPGFITDVAGATLFIPAVRRWLGAKLAQARQERRRHRYQHDRHVIDLAPSEWHQIEDQRPPRISGSPRASRSKRQM